MVSIQVNDTYYPRLYNQLRALDTGRGGNVKGRTTAGVVAFCHFRNGVCLGMKYVGKCFSFNILTNIIESNRCSVVSIRNNHSILNQKCTNFTTNAVGVFCPNTSHLEVALIELKLLFFTNSNFLAGIHTNLS